jgi:hypothetical protein
VTRVGFGEGRGLRARKVREGVSLGVDSKLGRSHWQSPVGADLASSAIKAHLSSWEEIIDECIHLHGEAGAAELDIVRLAPFDAKEDYTGTLCQFRSSHGVDTLLRSSRLEFLTKREYTRIPPGTVLVSKDLTFILHPFSSLRVRPLAFRVGGRAFHGGGRRPKAGTPNAWHVVVLKYPSNQRSVSPVTEERLRPASTSAKTRSDCRRVAWGARWDRLSSSWGWTRSRP